MTSLLSVPVPVPLGTTPSADNVLVPTDIEKRNVIDKTADFVARNGPAFEHKILINEAHNPIFSFLKSTDPHNAYYKKRIREIKSLLPGAQQAEVHYPTSFPSAPAEKKKPEAKEAKPVLLPPPEPEQWIVELPDISPLDLEVIKLTAQFVARNGKTFLTGLHNREQRNSQFDFLKPTHHLHRFFTALTESYTKVILPERNLSEKLAAKCDKQRVFKKIMERVDYEKQQRRLRDQENEEEKEREARAQIDWHDFVVVETITFDDDAKLPLPMPVVPVKQEVAEPEVEADMDMDMDMEMDLDIDIASEGGEIKIRKDYQKSRADSDVARALKYAKCPKCGEEIPIEEMEAHMEIELRDPLARKKKLDQMKRKRESILAEGSEIGKNLQDLSERRSDIFGESGEEVEMGKKLGSKDDDSKPKKIIWDGHTGSIAMTANAVMAAAAKQETGLKAEPPKIGVALPNAAPPVIIPPPVPGAGLLATPVPRPGINTAPPVMAPPPMMQMRPPTAPMMPPAPYPGMVMPGYPGMPPGYPMMGMGPPGAMMMMPPGDYGMPDAKRQKTNHKELIPEEEFLRTHPANVSVKVAVPKPEADDPNVRPEWNLDGQTLTIDAPLISTVMNLKHLLKGQLGGMPPNKQKLDVKGVGFLKDNSTLAFYNIDENVTITLGVKARGRGGKK